MPAPATIIWPASRIALANALVEKDHVVLSEDGGIVTAAGEDFFLGFWH